MAYYIDLSKISLDNYSVKLKKGYLPPSRKILLESTDEKFQKIKEAGISNIENLRIALKTKNRLREFARESDLPEEYLTILNREINSTLPKPNKIMDFPGIDPDVVEKLYDLGIKHTLHLYDRIINNVEREKLAKESGIDKQIILKLTGLTDLSRVKWVGHTFAHMLYSCGFKKLEELASADPVELHKVIAELNTEQQFYKANIGLNDMRICVEAAKEVPQDIDYDR